MKFHREYPKFSAGLSKYDWDTFLRVSSLLIIGLMYRYLQAHREISVKTSIALKCNIYPTYRNGFKFVSLGATQAAFGLNSDSN